jgi:lipopolysaccharide/colanic/teichoic acid biosynthesis glycosyltransferase
MKKILNYIIVIKIIFDFFIVYFSFFLAKIIRESSNFNLPVHTLDNLDLINYSLIWTSLLIIVFGLHWLYKFSPKSNSLLGFSRIILYTFYSFIFFSVIIYLTQDFLFDTQIPRLIIIFAFIISIIWIIINRILLILIENKFWNKSKVLIISHSISNNFYKLINSFKKSKNYKIKWVWNNYKLWLVWIKEYNFKEIKKLIKDRKIDEILYINSDLSKENLLEMWDLIKFFGIKYKYIANSFDLAKANTFMTLMNNIPVLEIQNTSMSEWNNIYKRIFDLIWWILWTILFSPILIIVSVLIKIEDPKWPIIFKNRRVGKDWKEFNLYKFRYMKWKFCTKESYKVSKEDKKEALEFENKLIKKSSSRSWPLYKIQNDPRKTKIWAFIEKYSIDELPQFFNVIFWTMSIVWPRPHQPREVQNYEIEHNRLLIIKPWITWMAQVNGRETNSFEDEANLDLYYIDNWSLLLEFKIVLKTIYVVLSRK